MKQIKKGFIPILLSAALIIGGCASATKTQKGAVIGTAAGATMGAVIGKTAGNTALGAIVGAAVGGTTGAIIGSKMDKQAEEIKSKVPDADVMRIGEGIVVEFSSNVLFDFGKSNLSNPAKNNLDKLTKVLETYPDTNIEAQGHTDSVGSEAFNQNLSEERANSVANYLVSQGVDSKRLSIRGFGQMLPKYLNNTEAGRDKNRRVEFLITANEKMKADAAKQTM